MQKKAPKNPSYKTYNNKFKDIVKKKIPVTGIKFDTDVSEIITNIDDWKQCYDPHDKARSQLPSYWFVSKQGFLISVNGNTPRWVKPNLEANRPLFTPSKKGKVLKPITTYDLTALVWGSYREPDAQTLLNAHGLEVLGKNKIDKTTGKHLSKVQVHHTNPQGYLKDGSMESYIINNDPAQLQVIVNRDHDMLTYMTGDFEKDITRDTSKFSEVLHTGVKIYQDSVINNLTGEVTTERKMVSLEDAQRMTWKTQQIVMEFLEKDHVVKDGYIFVREDGREFIEKNIEKLLLMAKSNPPQSTNIVENRMYVGKEVVYYQKLEWK